ncbi:class I SAM-dependent methyltransferase [Desulfosporosinus acidiphilus]|uniref:class I SAM-dependent methyltransferase n=1 Tax=Desulfosporosinus acidiphilus TaxID=885581 RepID=UPI00031E93DA|nr:methyltransferase domain-containing protein [Desulfosporosinus acidiphilus]
MIERAQERADQVTSKNVAFLLSSMEKIPIGDECLDAVLSNFAINHVEDKVAVYREIHRTLKPGGRFVVSDHNDGNASTL